MMRNKMYAALIASVSLALTLASNQALGGSRAAHHTRSAYKHSTYHLSVARAGHHHRGLHRGAYGAYWPGTGYYYALGNGEAPDVVIPGPSVSEQQFTCTYDIPWDWVHRCPPAVSYSPPPSDPVAMSGCTTQTVTIPRGDGKEQRVTIIRC